MPESYLFMDYDHYIEDGCPMPSHELIRARRRALGLSLEDLAGRLRADWPNVDKPVLSRLENGKRGITIEELRWIAKALNCQPADLIEPL